ncbi:MAG: hypothetical protein HYY06_31715 [Deltaproteobacteria bacterium]|nr:hypothetical protein [Deltaproteobacteria bacterium]
MTSFKAWRVEALCSELEQGRWAIPPTDEGRILARDLLLYSHERRHGDRLAALLVAVEGMRDVEGRRKVGWATIDMR